MANPVRGLVPVYGKTHTPSVGQSERVSTGNRLPHPGRVGCRKQLGCPSPDVDHPQLGQVDRTDSERAGRGDGWLLRLPDRPGPARGDIDRMACRHGMPGWPGPGQVDEGGLDGQRPEQDRLDRLGPGHACDSFDEAAHQGVTRV